MRDNNPTPTQTGRWPLVAILAVAFCLGGLLQGCGGNETESSATDSLAADSTALAEKPAESKKAKKPKQTSVTVAKVIRADLVLPIIAEGSIRALQSTRLRSEISGRIQALRCREGDRVRKGQILVSLDKRDYKVALSEAHSLFLQALSQMAVEGGPDSDLGDPEDLAKLDADLDQDPDRLLAAIRQGAYSYEIKAARTGLAVARSAAERAQLNLERCDIRAPFSGVVTGLQLSTGEWVSAAQELFTLVDDVNLEARVDVLESDLGQLVTGRPALVAIPALNDTLQVNVDVISPQLDVSSRSCEALLRIRDDSGRVRPGMFVRTAIAGEILPDRLLVPREAVLNRDGRPLVFKIEDGISHWLYVVLGERNDRFVEIKQVLQGETLEPGDPVVVSDHLTLTHGAPVKIKKTLEPHVPWRLTKGNAP